MADGGSLGKVLVGTSGWTYRHWADGFYAGVPRRRWLEHYAAHFPAVEVNTTFYGLPRTATVAGWRAQVPPGFRFVCKGSRYVTHLLRLRPGSGEHALRLVDRLLPLGPTLAGVLWQLPPDLPVAPAHLDDLLATVARALPPHVAQAVELRNPGWRTPEVYAVLAAHQAVHVQVSGFWEPDEDLTITGGAAYARLHGTERGYGHEYTVDELQPWASFLQRCGSGFAFFDNDGGGAAVRNALQLRAMLGPVAAAPPVGAAGAAGGGGATP